MINDVQVYRRAECGSDHLLLKAKFYFTRRTTNNRNNDEITATTKNVCHMFNIKLLEDDSIYCLSKLSLAVKMSKWGIRQKEVQTISMSGCKR